MRALFCLLLAAMLSVGCNKQSALPQLQQVAVESQLQAGEEYPSQLLLHLRVENPAAAVKLLQGRVRVSYQGRRVAMLTLLDKVKVPRGESDVVLPLRLNLQHSSQAMQLRAALRRGDMQDVEIDWQVAIRRALVYLQREGGPTGFDELAGVRADVVREAVKEIFAQEVVE